MLALVCFVGAQAAWKGDVASRYDGGDGTKAHPYEIATAEQWAKFAQDVNSDAYFSAGKYFVLTADIVFHNNVCKASSPEGGKAFTHTPMVGVFNSETDFIAFEGVLDGQGHSISGLYNVNYGNFLAPFKIIRNATIKNLGIKDSYVYANANFSGLVCRIVDSKVINCYVAGGSRPEGYGSWAAPLVSQACGNSQIVNCYSEVNLVSKNNASGMVSRLGNGDFNEVLVENCVSLSSVTTSKSNKAGLVAEACEGSLVKNCFYLNTLSTDIYALKAGQRQNNVAKSLAEMKTQDFVDVLNARADTLKGACRWMLDANGNLTLDYSTFTPDEEIDYSAMAMNPSPASGELHADADTGSVLLSWSPALDGLTVKQYLYIDTDEAVVKTAETSQAQAILAKDTCYLYHLPKKTEVYYWRVDREDADGKVSKGNVWSFRARLLAFPGAEGYGRFAYGGRGGHIEYVTNLNSSGPGSFRHAVTNGSGPRIVLFKVSGLIDLGGDVICDPSVHIAAQSAPGKGVCFWNGTIGVADDGIARFVRSRRGGSAETGGSLGFYYANNAIIDHCTASWGTDETFSSRNCYNITFQRSMIAEALGIAGHRNYPEGTNHGYAATIGGDIGSFHHNLLANCAGRNWSMGGGKDANGHYGGRLDIFNNVVYNWHSRTTDGGAHEVNFVGNYYKMGRDTKNTTLLTLQIEGNLPGTQSVYVKGNIRDNKNGTLTQDALNDTYKLQISDGRGSLSWEAFVDDPFFPSYATIETAEQAYKSTLSDVGANMPMTDDTDARVIRETLTRTHTYVGSKSGIHGEIDNEADAGGYELYPEETRDENYDKDNDGLPNWYERIIKTHPNSEAGDYTHTHRDSDNDGFSNIDEYLHFIASPYFLMKPGAGKQVDLSQLFLAYSENPVYTLVETSDSEASIAVIEGNQLLLTAPEKESLHSLLVEVKDARGDTYRRRINVAVTDLAPLHNPVVMNENDIVAYQLYSLSGILLQQASGLQAASVQSLPLGELPEAVYVLVATDSQGNKCQYKLMMH